ncbi:hypothetical protein [Gelidibacter japonicus]|uniref:hypothetical protein n=1 Tax=Gelidibacter japonicus TaxID=1962232 RepID=UPI002AFFD5D2|nr:hypothetical protein [Gelidibacter japonicus]
MYLYRFGFLCCFMMISSCKTVSVQGKQYQTTTKQVTLGAVGIDETYDFERTYSYSGIPNYTVPVKVQVTPIAFNKTKFKAFSTAREFQTSKVNLNFVDSLPEKPKFLNIETFDIVGLINLLNSSENGPIKTYLQNQNQSHVVTNISIALNEKDMEDLTKAQAVFIEHIGLKTLGLSLYSNKTLTRTINFNDGVVFAYRAASVCWRENSKYQLEIVELVEGDNRCPNQTYSSAKKAQKKVDYFNF